MITITVPPNSFQFTYATAFECAKRLEEQLKTAKMDEILFINMGVLDYTNRTVQLKATFQEAHTFLKLLHKGMADESPSHSYRLMLENIYKEKS